MQQIIKTCRPFQWIAAIVVATAVFLGCNDASTKTEVKTVDTMPAKMTPVDSLPPLDPTATPRPEDRKTK